MERASFIEILNLKTSSLTMKVNNNHNQLFLGYMRITDLGIARVWNPDNAKDTSGTPGYMGNSIQSFFIFMT